MSDEYVLVSSDVLGFWNGEGTIHFRPTSKKIFKNKKFPDRDSVMIVGVALGKADLVTADGDELQASSGDIIGVWYSPGMRELLGLCDCKVKMKADGERDVGKGSPMKAYKIARSNSDTPRPLPTSYDYRRTGYTEGLRPGGEVEDYEDVPF